MKVVLALAFLVCAVTAEFCDHDSDCTLTQCGTNFRLDCYRDNVCTCIPTGTSSSYACSGDPAVCNVHGKCTHGDHKWHCVDSKCVCRFWG